MRNLKHSAPENNNSNDNNELFNELNEKNQSSTKQNLEEFRKKVLKEIAEHSLSNQETTNTEDKAETTALEDHKVANQSILRAWKSALPANEEVYEIDASRADELLNKTSAQIQNRWGKQSMETFSTDLFG